MTTHFGAKSTSDQVLRDIDLSGKNVLITGANVGIGFESALSIAKHKANVYASKERKKKKKNQKEFISCFSVIFLFFFFFFIHVFKFF